ncbi:MAG: hypothetical protein JNK25_01630 [Phycisphaerae bacterium]|nr:hypothetical protein [Phycisphaerae bacterium]
MKRQARVIATGFALLGFAIAVLSGLAAGNDAAVVLPRSLIVLIGCRVLGAAAGAVLDFIGREQVAAYEAARPIPDFSLTPASAPSGDEKILQNLNQRR